MLRAGQSLPPKGLSTLRFDAGRFPPTPAVCYRASWQLPGPDSHRLADTSLRVDYLNATTSKGDITSRTHAAGHTKLPLVLVEFDVLADDAICLLDVPVHKTGSTPSDSRGVTPMKT